ncbi:hypothetical protein SASC598O11_012190 [Snodgrassella alvi SCGC AB-598-O11]|nr:hypothetical protein SASC598O11_012190 [Snodgrassella alvi SCGC AB-598-O11]
MNKEQNKFIGMCLAKNNYFAACICNTEKTEKYICVQVIVYRKDTWEFYKSFSLQSLILTSDYSQWYEQAENFIALLDKPEDWKRPHRFCLARYAKKVVRDNFFYENLAYLKKVNNIDIYIWYYDKDSRFQEFLLIKNLNMLSDEEKKTIIYTTRLGKRGYFIPKYA